MQKIFLVAGTISAGLSVAIGAFGAHALKSVLTKNGRLDVFETGVKYQMYHALALLLVGVLLLKFHNLKMLGYAGYSFIAGSLIFSGSLYMLCLTNVSKWGAVTPIGGICLLAGWIFFLLAVMKFQ